MVAIFSVVVAFVCCFVAAVYATKGVDVSQRTQLSSWQSLKSSGYNFAMVRVYCSSGVVDSNGAATIIDAWNGGMAHVDGTLHSPVMISNTYTLRRPLEDFPL